MTFVLNHCDEVLLSRRSVGRFKRSICMFRPAVIVFVGSADTAVSSALLFANVFKAL